jgi:hypothetical protein
MNDLLEIQAELKQLHKEFLDYAEKIKDVSRRLGLLVKDSDNVILKWQVHHHWLNNVDRKFKILDEELDNEIAAPFSALPPAINNPVYKDLTLKIEAFRLLNPDMDEPEAQKRISKIVKEHIEDRKKIGEEK